MMMLASHRLGRTEPRGPKMEPKTLLKFHYTSYFVTVFEIRPATRPKIRWWAPRVDLCSAISTLNSSGSFSNSRTFVKYLTSALG